ncbi:MULTISPECIES: DUF2169 domain-containing protein [unclassified Serratia (in: enterobacteria)]|uniref:DUF2169 family type VI secretion system accessory protein n=1 Tax=unclassified Serratia (in: enterobacteria) TaxID=2647522 RepID=UPI000500844B|nr:MULTISPECIES: DUF2169 domain-containing protein [unclassified Serratia (in: enterobacteria)]KFK97534.1 hypothetical protein JV45_01545 [Serratia sp. Ag2]KFK98158.1 hypothetical protein IV04_14810 [Serratia sp. Ag1]
MRIIKPLRLGMMNRPCFYKAHKPYLGIAVLALVDMGAQPMLRPEPELWQLAQRELSSTGGVVDTACPKYYAEFLATGQAYPHNCLAENVCRVSITLGEKQKSLIVSGDRQWQGATPTAPRPFTSLPLDWSHAYGGPLIADNPLGIGAEVEGAPQPLPNIELPNERVTEPAQRVTPAGFDAIDITWPARQAFIGKRYDEAWVQRGAIGLADDADLRLFNIAPRDQQWQEQDELPRGAQYRIENMHPEHAVLEGQLPQWKARCFAHHTEQGEEVFSEIALRQTTVWFLPHLEQLILVYHGELPLEALDDDAHGVHMLMPALEHQDQPRSLEHYRDVWIKRSDREKGSAFAFQDHDLLPEESIGPWIDNTPEAETEHPLQQNLAARKQAIYQDADQRLKVVDSKLYQEAKEVPDIKRPMLSQLPEFMAQMEEMASKAKEDAMQNMEQRMPERQEYDARRPTGPESMHKMRSALQQQQGALHPGQEEGLHQLYRLGVTSQNVAPRLSGEQAAQLRTWVIGKMAQDRNFTGCDLTGADLSHLDLSGANLTRAMLENADLSHCILDHATLTQTILARSLMSHTSLRYSLLNEATLAQAICHGCDFTSTELSKVATEGTQFERCNFSQATIAHQMFSETSLTDCDFSAASFDNVIFNGITLENPRFSSARLNKGTFVDSRLERAVFENAQLKRCSMTQCQADNIDFTRARLENCAFVAGTSLENARFTRAVLMQCNLRQMPLKGADLSFATLENCDLSEATLQQVTLLRVQANDSLFIRSNLEGADLRQASLIGSRLQKSRLIGCDLTAANLFRADISQAEIDDTTLMRDAWVKQMKIYPQRSKGAEQ